MEDWKKHYTLHEFNAYILTSSEADIALGQALFKLAKGYNSIHYVYRKADSKTKRSITRAYMR